MELNYVPDDDVLCRRLRVVALRPVLIRGHLCPYQHGELGRVYSSVSYDPISLRQENLPLEIIRSWILALLIRTEWTYIPRGIMH